MKMKRRKRENSQQRERTSGSIVSKDRDLMIHIFWKLINLKFILIFKYNLASRAPNSNTVRVPMDGSLICQEFTKWFKRHYAYIWFREFDSINA